MAITRISVPPRFAPAYKPVEYSFTSDKFPNSLPGESGITIYRIKAATSTDVATYGNGLVIDDVFIEHDNVAIGTWSVGQTLLIENTTYYDGRQRVLKLISNTMTVIDTGDLGEDTSGGTLSKFYDGYCLIATVTMENLSEPVQKILRPDPDNTITVDIRDVAQRSFKDVFELISVGGSGGNAAGYITQKYTLSIGEGYNIPSADGVNDFVIDKNDLFKSVNQFVVNAVQPYHHIDPFTGEPDLQWEDNLDGYVVNVGGGETPFLTYAPRGRRDGQYRPNEALELAMTDSFWLAFLIQNSITNLNVFVINYNASNVSIGSSSRSIGAPTTGSFIVGVGPDNLNSMVMSNAHHYTVAISTDGGQYVTELFTFIIDRECYNEPQRFYWINPLGGVDGFTFHYADARKTGVKRQTLSKPHMKSDLSSTRGDWQRRMFSTEIEREYRSTTKTFSKGILTYVAEDLFESATVRIQRYENGNDYHWTQVIPTGSDVQIPAKHGRLVMDYQLGVDEMKQRA